MLCFFFILDCTVQDTEAANFQPKLLEDPDMLSFHRSSIDFCYRFLKSSTFYKTAMKNALSDQFLLIF